mmetsp:Transcript_31956/g.96194  ORF Transcript_31956/g.96194 Transcript_31956/m.96194 type:complete len:235 (-) Transcript_31956:130-834(-)
MGAFAARLGRRLWRGLWRALLRHFGCTFTLALWLCRPTEKIVVKIVVIVVVVVTKEPPGLGLGRLCCDQVLFRIVVEVVKHLLVGCFDFCRDGFGLGLGLGYLCLLHDRRKDVIILIVVVVVIVECGLCGSLGLGEQLVGDQLVAALRLGTNPRHEQVEVLVLGLVVHRVDDSGGFLHQLLAAKLRQLQLLNLASGVLLALPHRAAIVSPRCPRGINHEELGPVLLAPLPQQHR